MDMEAVGDNNNGVWVSVSELAERKGVSSQTIRNRIKEGLIEVRTFKRGKMRGILCRI